MVLVDPERDTGVVSPPRNRTFAMAVVEGGSFAYITTRTAADVDKSAEFGVHAYGPDASALAEAVAEQLRTWSREHRGGPGPQYRIYPAGTPDDRMPEGRVIDKIHSRVLISWPQAATAASGQGLLHPPTE
jgi:protein-L-isoaspartate(D-aspartate) O-methyltransferase